MNEVGPDPSDSEPSTERRKFAQLFGITEDDLVARGIDPDDYAREHVKEALKDRSKWDLALSKSTQYTVLWTRWGFRVFVSLFVVVGSLAISTVGALHWLGIALACVAGIFAITSLVLVIKYRRRYRDACRDEGLEPSRKRRQTGHQS